MLRSSRDGASAPPRGSKWAFAGLLAEAGVDLQRDQVEIAPVPGAVGAGVNFGVTAARALEAGKIDGFWANGMGTEVAVRGGFGTVVLDVRRGDGPKGCFNYTMASIAASEQLIARAPDQAAAAITAIVKTQAALKQDVARAGEVGRKLFPASEASLIADLIRRDLPYYDAAISREFVAGMNDFSCAAGILHRCWRDVAASEKIMHKQTPWRRPSAAGRIPDQDRSLRRLASSARGRRQRPARA